MIVDRIEHRALYHDLHPLFPRALEYLASFDPGSPDGRIELDGEMLFATVSRYQSSPATGRAFEGHRVYIDIQYLMEGRERILHAPVNELDCSEEYDVAADLALYADPPASSSVLVRSGDFVILFPGDAHKPGCMAGGREAVRKIVVKVAVQSPGLGDGHARNRHPRSS